MNRTLLLAAAASALVAAPAVAAPVVVGVVTVDAQANSTTGGSPLATGITLTKGITYRVTQSPLDLWSSGELPRFSDGNGIVPRVAVDNDDSGQPGGTQIGGNFGTYTQGAVTANYGSLVATDALGNPTQFLGVNNNFTVGQTGTLNLGYLDSNNYDNTGAISFTISAVPEPASWALMMLGFGAVGATLRRRPARRAAIA